MAGSIRAVTPPRSISQYQSPKAMTLVSQIGTDANTRVRPGAVVWSSSARISSPRATTLATVITAIIASDSRRRFDSARST